MADINCGPGWSDAQWEKVNNAVTEAFEKASVAAAFIPCYGPLPASAEYVKDEKLEPDVTGAKVNVTDNVTRKLFNLRVIVELSSEQVSDESLSTALLAFRRAANTLAQVEDDIVFNGFSKGDAAYARSSENAATKAHEGDEKSARVKGDEGAPMQAPTSDHAGIKGESSQGRPDRARKDLQQVRRQTRVHRSALVAVASDEADGLAKVDPKATNGRVITLAANGVEVGEALVSAVVKAIGALEDASHPEPFACVLGSNLFDEAHRPVKASMVLPADRIRPLLKGPLLRSGQMDDDTGIVVSLAGVEVDIVVATPPKVQFLQVSPDAKYVFRVYEKFRLRIKDDTVVQHLKLGD